MAFTADGNYVWLACDGGHGNVAAIKLAVPDLKVSQRFLFPGRLELEGLQILDGNSWPRPLPKSTAIELKNPQIWNEQFIFFVSTLYTDLPSTGAQFQHITDHL